jgi:hypothetical protein
MKIKLSKSQWQALGKKAGWMKAAQQWQVSDLSDSKYLGPVEFQSDDRGMACI